MRDQNSGQIRRGEIKRSQPLGNGFGRKPVSTSSTVSLILMTVALPLLPLPRLANCRLIQRRSALQYRAALTAIYFAYLFRKIEKLKHCIATDSSTPEDTRTAFTKHLLFLMHQQHQHGNSHPVAPVADGCQHRFDPSAATTI